MTRKRLAVALAVLVLGIGGYFWWTYDPDRDAIVALLNDVRAAVEAGNLEPALPSFRRDFTFGTGGGAITYDQIVVASQAAMRDGGIDGIEVRNLSVEVAGDFAEVRGIVHFSGSNRMVTSRPLPLSIELTRDDGETDRYRGWRLYRAAPTRPALLDQ